MAARPTVPFGDYFEPEDIQVKINASSYEFDNGWKEIKSNNYTKFETNNNKL